MERLKMVAGASHGLLSGLAIGVKDSRKAIKGRLAIVINALKATTLNVAVPQVQPVEPERIKRMPGRVGDLTPSLDAVIQAIRKSTFRLWPGP